MVTTTLRICGGTNNVAERVGLRPLDPLVQPSKAEAETETILVSLAQT